MSAFKKLAFFRRKRQEKKVKEIDTYMLDGDKLFLAKSSRKNTQGMWGQGVILHRVTRESLTEKGTFKTIPEGSEG